MKDRPYIMLDLFSGAGGFSEGFLRAGYDIKMHFYSEIDKHAIACYKHNFKNSEYVGSVTDVPGITDRVERFRADEPECGLIVTFGSPCQDFSLAGKRKGMDGERSSLITRAFEIISILRPDVFIWENVKGSFSSNSGADFWAIIQAFTDLRYDRLEWQLLNTAWLLPQNRERIYLVGHLGEGSGRNVFPIGEDVEGVDERTDEASNVRTITAGGHSGGMHSSMTLIRHRSDQEFYNGDISPTLRNGDKQDCYIKVNSATNSGYEDATEGDSINLSQPNSETRRGRVGKGKAQTLETSCNQAVVCLTERRTEEAKAQRRKSGTNDFRGKKVEARTDGCVGTILRSPTIDNTIQQAARIRRLTEIECERLQGFKDDHTKYGNYDGEVKEISRTQRYKLMGNAVTVDVVQMIAERL